MAILFFCPSGHPLSVDDKYAGRKIRCGLCGKITFAPHLPRAARPQFLPEQRDEKPKVQPATNLPIPSVLPPAAQSQPIAPHPTPKAPTPLRPPTQGRPTVAPSPTVDQPKAPTPDVPPEATADRPASAKPRGGIRGAIARFLRKFRRLRFRRRMPADAYQASAAEVRKVFRLAAILASVVIISVLPVLWRGHLNLTTAPSWALVALGIGGLQLMYVGWMLNAPDWATVRVVMIVFAAAATAYAVGMTTALTTPIDHPLMLGMGEVRYSAASWCAVMIVTMGAATWLCGRASTQWHRSILSRQAAMRGGTIDSGIDEFFDA